MGNGATCSHWSQGARQKGDKGDVRCLGGGGIARAMLRTSACILLPAPNLKYKVAPCPSHRDFCGGNVSPLKCEAATLSWQETCWAPQIVQAFVLHSSCLEQLVMHPDQLHML
jgi:hypothetical protein